MADKSSAWRPGPTVCRCCLAEGCYKDISTEYFWMGKREVYADMLADTLSLSIGYSKTGGPNSNSRLICEPCISRLRDATDFKRQVQECEKTFMQYLDPGSSSVMSLMDSDDIQMETIEKDVKIEQVKVEKKYSDDEFDSRDFGDDDDDDDDMDQPLTTFASKEPKKETINLLDLLESPKKKTTKPKLVAKKKIIIKKDVKVKPTTSKAVPKSDDKKRKEPFGSAARRNARLILMNFTAYPFRLPEADIMCLYCCEEFPNAVDFRSHMNRKHSFLNCSMLFRHCGEANLKTDCTVLQCRRCSDIVPDLNLAAKHLGDVHGVVLEPGRINLDPFKFIDNKLLCGVCDKKFPCLRELSKHVMTHCRHFICDTCGSSYTTQGSLRHHIKFSHSGEKHICRKCSKTFKSLEAKKKHVESSEKCWIYCCAECSKRFRTWSTKQNHLVEVHGLPRKTYPCPECNQVFRARSRYREHFATIHNNEYFVCTVCEKKFTNKMYLEHHSVVHTGIKNFQCELCSKSFSRKYLFTKHMQSHNDYKKYQKSGSSVFNFV